MYHQNGESAPLRRRDGRPKENTIPSENAIAEATKGVFGMSPCGLCAGLVGIVSKSP